MPLEDLFRTADAPSGDEPVYVISAAAELAEMHPQTIRGYERKGLINPQRTAGNTRRYSGRDIQRLRMIQHLTQEEGLNLAGVKMVMEMFNRLEAMQDRVTEADRLVREMADRLQEAESGRHRQYDLVRTGPKEVELHPTHAKRNRRPPRRRPLE